MKSEGIYTPPITPYHDGFSLNEQALEQTVEHLIRASVHRVIIAGYTTRRPLRRASK